VPPPSPRAKRAEISQQLDSIILKMLAKNPEDRYPDMASLTSALRLAAGPPFSVHRSSPDLANAPTQAAPTAGDGARAAKPQVTTFRTGMGEVVETQTGLPVPRGRGKLVAVVVALVVAGGGVYFLTGSSSSKAPPAAAAKPAPVMAEKPAPPVAPKPVVPAAPPKVTVRLATDPAGAKVFESPGARVLGTTPFSLKRDKGGVLKVRLEKDGYSSATRDVPLDEDQSLEFALERKPAPKPKPAHRSRDEGPAPAKL
jgi:hypothetical protein